MSGYSAEYYDDDYYEDVHERSSVRRFPRLVTRKFVHPISQPDKIDKYVNQTKVWIDAEGTEYKIKNIDKEYLFNILSWAENNKDRLNFTLNFLDFLKDPEGFPLKDIRNTKLIIKIRKEYQSHIETA